MWSSFNNPLVGVPLRPRVLLHICYSAEATARLFQAIAGQIENVQSLQKYESTSLSSNGGSSKMCCDAATVTGDRRGDAGFRSHCASPCEVPTAACGAALPCLH